MFDGEDFRQGSALVSHIAEKFGEKVNWERGRSISPVELSRLVGVISAHIDRLQGSS